MSSNAIDKVLVFDLWGTYGHFRRLESTTSPLTYSIPTGTAIAGIIAAILGFERDSYYEVFAPKNFKYSLRILSPVKKLRLNISLINTKEGFFLRGMRNPRTLIPYEVLVNPRYRVYVWLKDNDLFEKLTMLIKKHKSHYTPYLGIAPLIADFKFINVIENPQIIKKSDGLIEINSVLERQYGPVIPKEGQRYLIERIPRYFNEDRVVQKFLDIIVEANGEPISVRSRSENQIWKIGEENVIFF